VFCRGGGSPFARKRDPVPLYHFDLRGPQKALGGFSSRARMLIPSISFVRIPSGRRRVVPNVGGKSGSIYVNNSSSSHDTRWRARS